MYSNRSGLQNIGNTCFMNSALQCLASVDLLTNEIKSRQTSDLIATRDTQDAEVVKAFQDYLQNSSNSNNSSYNPSLLKNSIGKISNQFSGFDQQDAFHLMTTLLNSLSDGLNIADVNRSKLEPVDYDNLDEENKLSYSRARLRHRHNSPIVNYFYGFQKNVITCSHCQGKSILFQPFAFLSVPINNNNKIKCQFLTNNFLVRFLSSIFAIIRPRKTLVVLCLFLLHSLLANLSLGHSSSLRSAIQSYSKPILRSSYLLLLSIYGYSIVDIVLLSNKKTITEATIKNDYDNFSLMKCLHDYCAPSPLAEGSEWNCDHKTTDGETCPGKSCTFEILLYDLPPVLIIHLRRFTLDPFSVLPRMVKINDRVNYQMKLNMTNFVKEAGNSKFDGKNGEYSLVAVSRHFGSLEGGHYNAFCRSNDNNDKWFVCDDSSVQEIDPSQVLNDEAAIFLIYVNENYSPMPSS